MPERPTVRPAVRVFSELKPGRVCTLSWASPWGLRRTRRALSQEVPQAGAATVAGAPWGSESALGSHIVQ